MLVEALAEYGVVEQPGTASNPRIIDWAKEVGLYPSLYSMDSTPWCGLFMAVIAKRAGWARPANPLWALNWATFGNPAPSPMLGDVLVFKRDGGGHVGLYVGEDATAYHVLGGNQSDKVSFARIEKSRLVAARRPKWRYSQPVNVRRIDLLPTGSLSVNEQ